MMHIVQRLPLVPRPGLVRRTPFGYQRFTFAGAAYNLCRLRNLHMQAVG